MLHHHPMSNIWRPTRCDGNRTRSPCHTNAMRPPAPRTHGRSDASCPRCQRCPETLVRETEPTRAVSQACSVNKHLGGAHSPHIRRHQRCTWHPPTRSIRARSAHSSRGSRACSGRGGRGRRRTGRDRRTSARGKAAIPECGSGRTRTPSCSPGPGKRSRDTVNLCKGAEWLRRRCY